MLNWILWNRTDYLHKMDLALNNLRGLICHKTKQTKPNQSSSSNFVWFDVFYFAASSSITFPSCSILQTLKRTDWWQKILIDSVLSIIIWFFKWWRWRQTLGRHQASYWTWVFDIVPFSLMSVQTFRSVTALLTGEINPVLNVFLRSDLLNTNSSRQKSIFCYLILLLMLSL